MTEPKQRELGAVSKIPALSEQETKTLYQILQVLGFDIETIAFLWEKSTNEVRELFLVDRPEGAHIRRSVLTGRDLVWWCERLHLKPGVVQRRLNFDESPLRLRKQGHRSIRVPMEWVGPPIFAIKGTVLEGRAFVELASLVTLPARSVFSSFVTAQLAAGKFPLRLPALRDLQAALVVQGVDHPKVNVIETALRMFPDGVKTPEEMLDALTTEQSILPETVVLPSTMEEGMRVTLCDRFGSEFTRRGLETKLQLLRERCQPIQQLFHEWNIAIVRPSLYPGELEVLVTSKAFEYARRDHPNLAKPFVDLGEWLAKERKAEEKKRPTSVPVPTPAVAKDPVDGGGVTVVKKEPARVKSEASLPKGPTAAAPAALPTATATHAPQLVYVDPYGLRWDTENSCVVMGALSLPLSGAGATAQRRLYQTLKEVQTQRGGWDTLRRALNLEASWISSLVDSSSMLTPERVLMIIEGLKTHYGLELTPQQLFGLTALPALAKTLDEDTAQGVGDDDLLFPLGDTKYGVMWSRVLRKYRTVYRWFQSVYGVTEEHLQCLERGEIGVPLAVHLVLMAKVQERLATADDPVLPRALTHLLSLPQSEPVRNGTYVLDQTKIPHQHWLQNQK